jgi:hypothetical protein
MDDMIKRKNAILHIDVLCYKCERLMAGSYCLVIDGRYYCQQCTPSLAESIKTMKLFKAGEK